MTDPTPTPQTPPQGLTEDTLREQWNAQADRFNQWESLDSAEQFAWAQKCAIAAHEAARAQLPPNYVDPEHTGENRKLLEAFYVASRADGGSADEIVLRGIRAAIAAHEAARPRLTPEEVAARFRAWWAESFRNAPAGSHAVASHAAFALHLLGGEVAA